MNHPHSGLRSTACCWLSALTGLAMAAAAPAQDAAPPAPAPIPPLEFTPAPPIPATAMAAAPMPAAAFASDPTPTSVAGVSAEVAKPNENAEDLDALLNPSAATPAPPAQVVTAAAYPAPANAAPTHRPALQSWSAQRGPLPPAEPVQLTDPAAVKNTAPSGPSTATAPATPPTPALPVPSAAPRPALPAGSAPRVVYRVVGDGASQAAADGTPVAPTSAALARGRVWQPPVEVFLCVTDAIVRETGGPCPICHQRLSAVKLANPDPQVCPVEGTFIREPHYGMVMHRAFVFCAGECAPEMAGKPELYLRAAERRAGTDVPAPAGH